MQIKSDRKECVNFPRSNIQVQPSPDQSNTQSKAERVKLSQFKLHEKRLGVFGSILDREPTWVTVA